MSRQYKSEFDATFDATIKMHDFLFISDCKHAGLFEVSANNIGLQMHLIQLT